MKYRNNISRQQVAYDAGEGEDCSACVCRCMRGCVRLVLCFVVGMG